MDITENEDLAKKQQRMHKDMFDKCSVAIENGFYSEALMLEYSAIEGRLEVMLGLLGMPCNKKADDEVRRKVNISSRIDCLNYFRKNSSVFENTKLDYHFFEKKYIKSWIQSRNILIHALYKNADEYFTRRDACKDIAEEGLEYCRLLYNEVKRLRRLQENYPERFNSNCISCRKKNCAGNPNRVEKS